jgi:hypothetical protein
MLDSTARLQVPLNLISNGAAFVVIKPDGP